MQRAVATGETMLRHHARMQGTPDDFRLYHSNALEVLAGVLAARLRALPADGDWMRPDLVLVPQFAMRRWLQQFLAEHAGICANLRFLAPGEFVDHALDANLGPATAVDRLPPDVSRWRVLQALHDAPPAAYASQLDPREPLRAWRLACGLADTFESYQAWRRDLLLRWDAGADPDDPQARLWRAIAHGRRHRARRIGEYLQRFGADAAQAPSGLPPRLFAFACQNVSPDVLQVIASQSRSGEQHFFLHTPSGEFWHHAFAAGLDAWRAQYAPADDTTTLVSPDNSLLAAWGRAERDFVAALAGGDAVHARIDVAAFAQPEHTHLLGRMQADVLANVDPALSQSDDAHWPRVQVARDDASLRFHACHTRLREVQVLHDQLRALLEADPSLQAREIAVLAPDIDAYAPHVEAVFGGALGSERELPYTIADASPLASAMLASAFARLLDLPLRPLTLAETLDLLAVPAIAEQFGVDDNARNALHTWLAQAGARWGLDADERARHGGSGDAYTLAFALDRLLLGYASGAEDDIVIDAAQPVAPLPVLEGRATEALDALIRLLAVLRDALHALRDDKPPQQWARALDTLLLALCGEEPRDLADRGVLQRLREAIAGFAHGAAQAGFEAPVAHAIVRAELLSVLTQADARAPFLSGGVCFGRMVPMRLIPFRVICLLGMDDGAFPARDARDPLNRIAQSLDTAARAVGDPSRRDADRYLFLQLFSSASSAFHVSWQGFDPRDGSAREPASVVAELLDVAARYHADPAAARKDLVVRHALQPFSPAAFGAAHVDERETDPRRFSYDARWHGATAASTHAQPLAPFAPHGLVRAPVGEQAPLDLSRLRRALTQPQLQFLRDGLQLRLAEEEAPTLDDEPLGPPDALQRHALRTQAFAAWLRAGARPDPDALQAQLLARALAPTGADGRSVLAHTLDDVAPFADAALREGMAQASTALPYDLALGDVRLSGSLTGTHMRGLFRAALRPQGVHGGHVLRHRLDALVASALGMPLLELRAESGEVRLVETPPADSAHALAALRALFALQRRMASEPLPFLPKSAYAFVSAKDAAAGLKAAANEWCGGYHASGERSLATALALRGREPFVDGGAQAQQRFEQLARAVFAALLDADASLLEALP